jgi:hypothetical protein
MLLIDEDYQAWEQYPEYRWIFNKLELALKLGYKAGPACVPVPNTSSTLFKAIIRPIYNLYGMGINAKVRTFRPMIDNEFIINHGFISPGHFWCEYFEGKHYSIDYKKTNQPKGSIWAWEPFCAIVGEKEENNLTRFTKWTRIDPPKMLLPSFLNKIVNVDFLNVECIGDKIIEVHLRTGNDVLHKEFIGTIAIPIWDDEKDKIKVLEKQGYKFKGNHHSDSFKYSADGHLSDIRLGYMIK